jgi:hypothetical protein
MFKHSIRTPIVIAAACLLLAASWVGGSRLNTRAAQAAAPLSDGVAVREAAPESRSLVQAPAGVKKFNCKFSELGTGAPYNSQNQAVQVGCNPGDGAINFFVADGSDAKRTARMLSVALTAFAMGKQLQIVYDSDDVANLPCEASNCRRIIHVIVLP